MSPILLIIVGLIAVGLGVGIASWFARANPASVAKALRWGAIGLGFVVVVVLILVRPQLLPLLLIVVVPFLLWRRWRGATARSRPATNSGAGGAQHSAVETAYLRMALDHDSGEMRGEVLRGRFMGRELGSLDRDELLALLVECEANDLPSARLVENYLDRMFGADWRADRPGAGTANSGGSEQSARAPGSGPEMGRAEALELLGVAEGADRDAVMAAWRRLIKLNHPDHGGSKYIAAKLNEAKRVLLGE